jgi:hypothetical protein
VLVASAISLTGAATTASAAGTASISGVVTSAATGLPVAGGSVTAMRADAFLGSSTALIGSDGSYSISGLDAGSYSLTFSGGYQSGFVPQYWNQKPDPASADYIAVADGQALTGFDAQLQPGATVSGRVVSTTTPALGLAGIFVQLTSPNRLIVGSAVSAADGSFSVGGLAAGSVTIDARPPFNSNYLEQWWNGKDSFETADFFTITAGSITSDHTLALPSGATISGSVNTSGVTSVPLVNATVSAVGADGNIQFQGVSDQLGNYTIAGIASGQYRILFQSAGAENFGNSWWHDSTTFASATVVDVATGQSIVGIDGLLDAGATISGSVTGSGPSPFDFAIEPVDSAGGSVPVNTAINDDGTFTISHLAPGSYTLRAFTNGPDPIQQWWHGASSLAGATYFTVAAGDTLTGFAMTLAPQALAIVGTTPTISGTATVGQTLTAAPGLWTPASVGFAYQWMRNGVAISGATAPTFALTAADLGTVISVSVTGSSAGYAPVTLTSDPTSAVGAPTVTSAVPTVTGTTRVGKTLTAHAGVWGPAPVSLTYRWSRDGVRIAGANHATYEVGNRDAGHTLTVTVTGTKRGFASGSATSTPTSMVTGGRLHTSAPHISGAARHGSTLTAHPGSWGPGDVALDYSWSRNGRSITGATSSTYTLTTADVGTSITVTVTGSEPGFTTESRTSCSSGRIR